MGNWKRALIFGLFSAVIGFVVFTIIDLIAKRGFNLRSSLIAAFVFGILEFAYTIVEKRGSDQGK